MMNATNVDFACTKCAKCCHDLRLPLTVDEAIAWLARGGTVELLCEAVPWHAEPPPENLSAAHKRRRSFAGRSGRLPVRLIVILAAAFAGPCPNLMPDNRCGIYALRPLVCRIYPAEINPFIGFEPRNKACPPEAWSQRAPAFVRGGRLVDASTAELAERSRAVDANEAPLKEQLCRALGIDRAAISNEGFVVHTPNAGLLLDTLRAIRAQPEADIGSQPPLAGNSEWRLLSNRKVSVDALVAVGADGEFADNLTRASYAYLSLFDSAA
ncbi:YkgJ family cysteine cluster protein [Trinickia sp.]|uniref:YkgJ family cysteine cluster protein n=1 Tax=Trinickia sp. TaxID=2571163 RepID=UPI003F81F7C0